MGGYSSTLFHLLYRFSPEIRGEFGRAEEGRWIECYGFVEHTIGCDDPDSFEDGRTSRRKRYRKVVRERPGLAPAALFHLIGNSVFLRLSDVASGLPPYEERVLLSSMDTEADGNGLSRRSGYDELFGTLRAALADALSKGSRRPLATYLQTLLAYPDGSRRARRSSIRRARSCSCKCRRSPRTGSTPRSGRSSTSSPPPSGCKAAACSSTPRTRARATSPGGWRIFWAGTASGSR